VNRQLFLALMLAQPYPQGSPAEVSYYLSRLASPVYLEREEATSILHRCCVQDKANITRVGAGLDSTDPEVRWRAWAVIRQVDPCEVCRGSGKATIDLDCGSYRIKSGTPCRLCEGTGSLWRPGRPA
jgi:hypothetical protein